MSSTSSPLVFLLLTLSLTHVTLPTPACYTPISSRTDSPLTIQDMPIIDLEFLRLLSAERPHEPQYPTWVKPHVRGAPVLANFSLQFAFAAYAAPTSPAFRPFGPPLMHAVRAGTTVHLSKAIGHLQQRFLVPIRQTETFHHDILHSVINSWLPWPKLASRSIVMCELRKKFLILLPLPVRSCRCYSPSIAYHSPLKTILLLQLPNRPQHSFRT